MSKNNELQSRLFKFATLALEVMKSNNLPYKFRNIENQLIKSSTSIGANYNEAQHAVSKADFRNKIHISTKEARETLYWLDLLTNLKLDNLEEINQLRSECEEIVNILCTICKKIQPVTT